MLVEDCEPKVSSLLSNGAAMLERNPNASAVPLDTLRQRWDNINRSLGERKGKLEDAVEQANAFQEKLNGFTDWLTKTEAEVADMKPVSRVLDVVKDQIKEQEVSSTHCYAYVLFFILKLHFVL